MEKSVRLFSNYNKIPQNRSIINNKHLILTVPESRKSKIKLLAGSSSDADSRSISYEAASHSVLTWWKQQGDSLRPHLGGC